MTTLDIPFLPVTDPPDAVPPTNLFNFPDKTGDSLTCEVCGVGITYAGRGRKPKRCDEHKRQASGVPRNKTTANTADVARACDVMQGLYDTALTGLLLFAPNAATAFAESSSKLNSANVSAFTSDPNLRDAVIRFGTRSGMAIFVTAHLSAILPPALIIYSERASKTKAKATPQMTTVAAEDVAFVQSPSGPSYPNHHLFE